MKQLRCKSEIWMNFFCIMKNLVAIIVLFVVGVTAFAKPKLQEPGITGMVYEMVDGKEVPVPFASIMCVGTIEGTFAGTTGDFELPLKEGKYKVLVSCYGYKPVETEIRIKKKKGAQEVSIELKSKTTELAEK